VKGHSPAGIVVVVSKANMTVTQDAQALAKRERVQARERVVRHGHGKTATEERLRTVEIMRGSPSTPWWCAAGTIGHPPPMAPST
jgi:hypothetical protein